MPTTMGSSASKDAAGWPPASLQRATRGRQAAWRIARSRSAGLSCRARAGAALIELVFALPVLTYILLAVFDFGRIFYYTTTVDNCARNGALYAADSAYGARSGFVDVTDAALRDAGNLNPRPTVTSISGTDDSGSRYVDVTVTFLFNTASRYPGLPSGVPVTRTCRMYVTQQTPDVSEDDD